MEERKGVSMDVFTEKYAGVYHVELLLKEPVESRALTIRERLLKGLNEVDDVVEQEGMYSCALCNRKVTYKDDVKVPSQLFIIQMTAFDKMTIPELVLQQCWSCENVEELLKGCQYKIMSSDFMMSGLPVRERCKVLAAFADITMRAHPEAAAIYWPHAGKIVSRADWLDSNWSSPALHFLDDGASMQLSNIAESSKEIVDTAGLTTIGLYGS